MAKKVIEEKEVVVDLDVNKEVDTLETKEEKPKTKQAPVEEVQEIRISKTKEKLVEIHTTEEIEATIGGVKYNFRKDTDQKVPVDVAAILSNSKKAYRK